MDRRRAVRLSKLVSLLLRHDPARAGLELDRGGWVAVDDLLRGLARLGRPATREELEHVAADGSKPRFELSGGRIRARYGHSIAVELGYAAAEPPPVLYHGTATRRLDRIMRTGVSPMSRQQVHLSSDVPTARQVGSRHGRPVVLRIDAASMAAEGTTFHRLPGGTWLVDEVPPRHILDVIH